jgi:hypothetical protein
MNGERGPQRVVLMPKILNWVAVPADMELTLQRSPSPSYGGWVS